MAEQKFIIPEITAQSVLSSAVETENGWRFRFSACEESKEYMVEYTRQSPCPIFYQALALLTGNGKTSETLCPALSDVFVYINFTGIFNRRAVGKVLEQQRKAERMLTEGIEIDFGKGFHRYLAFERSASMSRDCRLSFVREDLYAPLRERVMLGMQIGKCQLSKLYAYNGLMFTGGERFDIDGLLSEKRIVVIDNPKSIVSGAHIITVEDDGTDGAMRKYTRVEKTADVEVLEFDGEGLLSTELRQKLDSSGSHHSFQIRLPYIKGVVHEVDLKGLFSELSVTEIVDIWGEKHSVFDVDLILTKSMFKGFGWMTERGLSWAEYLFRCRKYDHALYVSGKDKLESQDTVELNYQFLNTLALTNDEFRPRDLPLGWDKSPETDSRQWVTKTTETAYYDLISDENGRQTYFSAVAGDDEISPTDRRRQRAKLVQINPLFIEEEIYAKELRDKSEAIQKSYSLGRLLVSGDNRYLSDDLLRLVAYIVKTSVGETAAYLNLQSEFLQENEIYAPAPSYSKQNNYTLLRSPHIARNEEANVVPLKTVGCFRQKYFSHLRYVLMVDSRSLIPERLGGADYDGDMVKTIADPLINAAVLRGYTDGGYLPVLKIPAAEPMIADADNLRARFEVVKGTFSNRVGLISNTALRRGVTAYDENLPAEERIAAMQDAETLAILTGLEIDSVKSGVRPDLTAYLKENKRKKSLFLRYKNIVDDDNGKKEWYEESQKKRIKKFIESVDWDTVSSNLERLPYLAYMLGKQTKKHKAAPASDEQLFTFAGNPAWKDQLDPALVERIRDLIDAYEESKKRVQYLKHIPSDFKRKKDIERILFSLGQENEFTVDELYACFDNASPEQIRRARFQLSEQKWFFTPPEDRRVVIFSVLPCAINAEYLDLFCDFRCGGYRLLGDVICDLDEMYRNAGIRKNAVRKEDGADMKKLMYGVMSATDTTEALIRNCIMILHPLDRREKKIDFTDALQCAVALGERKFALEVLPGIMADPAVRIDEPEKSKRKERRRK